MKNQAISKDRKSARKLLKLLENLVNDRILQHGDFAYALWLYERQDEHDAGVLLAAAHLCSLTRKGHVGASIPVHINPKTSNVGPQIPLFDSENPGAVLRENKKFIETLVQKMPRSLEKSAVIGSKESARYPLILDKNHLYFQRYWNYETTIAGLLKMKATEVPEPVDWKRALEIINKLFSQNINRPDWQKTALWISLKKHLLILSGGPGTGKTYTLIRLVALHYLLNNEAGHPLPKVALAAPTGKAAARINESITQSIAELYEVVPNKLVDHLPTEAETIHRLLGTRRNHPEFRYNRDQPLPHDMVVVDEASMVDIALMTKLLEALKPKCRLILIGDKDQLASVEAGSVLGDICSLPGAPTAVSRINQFSNGFFSEAGNEAAFQMDEDRPALKKPLLDGMVELEESRRFKNSPEIGQLARAVNANSAERALTLLRKGKNVRIEEQASKERILSALGKQDYVQEEFVKSNADQLFRAWRSFQTLCAHRRGPGSSSEINRAMDRRMKVRIEHANGYRTSQVEWYAGRPVIVTANLYELQLFNGDIGLTVRDPENENRLSICFEHLERENGEKYRFIRPAKLVHYKSAWALTVHKSQGSEFNEVQFILPDQLSPVMTRELIYTALTRSKNRFRVWGKATILGKAIGQKIQRTGALSNRLWGS